MNFSNWRLYCKKAVLLAVVAMAAVPGAAQADEDRIRPYVENAFFWQYKGEPTLLLGGTRSNILFQIPDLEEHLDLLVSVGGNYVRNTMRARDPGDVEAFAKGQKGYNLEQWNPEYWDRFDRFLQLTHSRDIIVQIELWDPWDYPPHRWGGAVFNPANNINYTEEESRLPTAHSYEPAASPTGFSFYRTPPELDDNTVVRYYQEKFVNEVLTRSLHYPNVLYCINNELGEPHAWSEYWTRLIHRRAEEAGVTAYVTDMRRTNDINAKDHRLFQDRPDLYNFIEVSQNNGGPTRWSHPESAHWDPLMALREYLTLNDLKRPMNNVKIYGQLNGTRWGGAEQGVQKFWRNIFAGCASARFHQPSTGIGLTERAQSSLRSMRMLTNAMTVFTCDPRNDLLSDREPNEAYCMATPGKQYAVYFPDGGAVKLDVSAADGPLKVRWLDIDGSAWQEAQTVDGGGILELKAPGDGQWAALVLAR